MGNLFSRVGVDSVKCGNDLVARLVYVPPDRNEVFLEKMRKYVNQKQQDTMFFLQSGGKKVSVIQFNNLKSNTIMIYSHGNAEDIFSIHSEIKKYSEIFESNFVAYDYPGYGLSDGNPSEESSTDALKTVIDYYSEKYGADKIILIGRSLGTGITISCVYRYKLSGAIPIILISPYKSIGRVVCDSCVLEMSIARHGYKTYSIIEKLENPIKIVHGTHDDVINVSHGKYLYDRLKNPLIPIWKEGFDHNNFSLEKDDLNDIFIC